MPDQTWASLIATADHDAQTLFQPLTVKRFILVLKTIIGIARSLERSMGRLATLSLPAKEVQTQPPSRASTSSDGSSPPPSISTCLTHPLRLCIRYGAHGLVLCEQGHIRLPIDWLEFAPLCLAALLPPIIPVSASSVLAGTRRIGITAIGSQSVASCHWLAAALQWAPQLDMPSMLVCCGGSGSAIRRREIHVLNVQTLQVTVYAYACSTAGSVILPDVVGSHAMVAPLC